MDEISFSTWLTWLLMAAFLGAGLLTLIGRKNLRETYARWNYPEGYGYATGVIYIAAAILLAGPYRMLGLALVAMLLSLLIVTLLDPQGIYGCAVTVRSARRGLGLRACRSSLNDERRSETWISASVVSSFRFYFRHAHQPISTPDILRHTHTQEAFVGLARFIGKGTLGCRFAAIASPIISSRAGLIVPGTSARANTQGP